MPLEVYPRRSSSVSFSNFSTTQPAYTPTLTPENYEMSPGKLGVTTWNHPIDPSMELVFVHGFLGDSSLTWTFENDRAMFWPEWLIDDVQLRNVRLHTYGYHEPMVNGRAPVSKISEIGATLATSLDSNNYFRADSSTPIVFIAHSLGGLVVKAAIESATRNSKLAELVGRFYGLLFLSTPHRDTDDRRMLSDILRACNISSSRRDFVEPEPNTACLQEINNVFYSCSQGLQVYDFYGNTDIVDRKRATLVHGQGLEFGVNADHISIAKFQSSSDPTYLKIKDVVLKMATEIYEQLHNPETVDSDIRTLADQLGVAEDEDEDLNQKEQFRVPESCEWLLGDDSFIKWRDRESDHGTKPSPIYLLSGDPGSGKSYIAARVITHLQEMHTCDSSFYFLKHGDISKQTLGGLLKSIALQMSRTTPTVRQAMFAMQKEGTLTADPQDLRALWRQLFTQRIFRCDVQRHQYWIIDALDEAKGGHELFALLKTLPADRYSVFITSRREREIEREMKHVNAISRELTKEDTIEDIRAFLLENEEDLPDDDPTQMQLLITKLMTKSNGSFLWTNLMLKELADQWTVDDVDSVLNNVPDGMQHLYARILRKISLSPNADLAESILRWTICSIRPLSVGELRTAVRLDIDRTLKRTAQAIESICQPLIRISNSHSVEVVHDTVRDYLFNKDRAIAPDGVPDLLFDKGTSHEHIAIICLTFLVKWRAPSRRMSNDRSNAGEDENFFAYASTNFSEHVQKSAAADESSLTMRLLNVLDEFFQGPILYWIQRQAENRTLRELTRAGKNLKFYIAKRLQFPTHLGSKLQDLHGWADDLIHLVSAFSNELYKDPGAIQSVIPSLCPSQSKFYSDLRNPDVGLQVFGLSQTTWPDHISSSSFGRDYANALASCEKAYAVALRTNQIIIYYTTTCQEARRIKTTEATKRLEFANVKNWLLASGRTSLNMYDYETKDLIWTTHTATEILALTVPTDASHVLAVTRDKAVETYNIRNGQRGDSRYLEQSRVQNRPPMQIHISHDLKFVAVIHRHEELELYDLDTLQRSKARIAYSTNIETVAFNQHMNMLAMAAFDGELCTIELWTMRKKERIEADASHLAVSTDGKTLIVGTKAGDIQIHDFVTLAPLHNIRYHEQELIGLCYTSNSLRFLDIRRSVFNVWEPAALVRRNEDDDTTSSDGRTAFSTAPSELMQAQMKEETSTITAVVEHSERYLFAAKDDGTVTVYETLQCRPKHRILEAGRAEVLSMAWNPARNLLACADTSCNVRVHQVLLIQERRPAGAPKVLWQVKIDFFRRSIQQPIQQIVFSQDGEFLLVCSATKESVFRTNGGAPLINDAVAMRLSSDQYQKWATFSKKKHQIYDVQGATQVVTWDKDGTKLRFDTVPATEQASVQSDSTDRNAYLTALGSNLWAAYDRNPHTQPVIWQRPTASLPEVAASASTAPMVQEFNRIATQIQTIVGLYRGRIMVFISVDHWICSLRVDKAKFEDPPVFHFPIPHSWRRSDRPLKALINGRGDVVFAVEGDLVVVRDGLRSA